ncbi:MAG TPA: EpsG family protein [Candidatus Blautia excrementipullorum]|nr:EpsG family protein [Candidatus Blautia excrementipullorum]
MKKKAVTKPSGFFAGIRTEWSGMRFFSRNELCRLDWILSFLILAFLFVTCAHSDVKLTGNRSFLMYEHFTDFYQASYEQSGGYWANYLPSTFIAYAVWNLPLYLTGHVPEEILTNSFVNTMWYKLLPVILYFATAQLMYKIGKEMGFGEKKSLLCKFAFLIFPMGVFSQFIFSQYDIFTVFFIVLGFWFYLRGKLWKTALMFGIAATFKYHAILYFLALILLKEKKIRNLLKYTVVMALPLLVEIVPNLGSEAFRRNVFGFGALEYVQKSFAVGFFSGINLMAAVAAFVLVWAYQKKTENQEALASWAVFFCVAVSFAIFGFSTWNPQWILLMAPFLVLNILISENGNLMLMITNIFMLALYIFSSQSMVDERVLNGGILKYVLKGRNFAVRMWDLYRFHNQELLCTAMWIVLVLYVVFGHPRYHTRKGTQTAKGLIWQMRAAFLFGTAAFMVPALVCAAGVLQGKVIFYDNSRQNMEMDNVAMLEKDEPVIQEFQADGSVLSDIKIRVYAETGSSDSLHSLNVVLREKDSGEVLYESQGDTYGLKENTALYSFLKHPVDVEKGKMYELEITSDAPEGSGLGLYCVTEAGGEELLSSPRQGDLPEDSSLQMCVTGIE